MLEKLSHITMITPYDNADVEKATNSWTSERATILDRHSPKIRKRIKRNFQPVWLNTEIQNL